MEEELKKQVVELSLEKEIHFMGYVPYEQVVRELQKSDIFILPSYYEALGCVYLEAMACGVPPIGCHNNGIDEVIKNGVDGYLVEPQNSKEIVWAVERLLDDNARRMMGEKARLKVEKHYTWNDSAESVKEIYENCKNIKENKKY